nr:hypothetical protein [Tanacetum cinerariifolium]
MDKAAGKVLLSTWREFRISVGLLRTQEGCYDWSYQAEEEPANFALMAITSSISSSDNEVPSCSNAYAQLHSQYDKLTTQTNDKHGLGYFSLESDPESLFPSSLSDRLQPSGGYPPSITRTFMQPKPDLVFHTAHIAVETDHSAFIPVVAPIMDASLKPTSLKSNISSKRKNRKTCFVCRSVDHLVRDCDFHTKKKAQPTPRNYAHRGNNKQNASFIHKHPQKHMVPSAMLTQFKPVSITAVRPVCVVVPKIMAPVVSVTKELNGGYVAFGGNPKGGKISGKGKIKTVLFITKDETSPILKTFITGLENQLSLKVKVIRSDNGTEFKNSDLNQFYELKGIKKEFSVPRTPQQNSIAERKNRTLIEAARTMLADSLLPIPFWAEAVNTACYVQNRVLVTKPHNKTPYELLHGRTPSIGFMRPFGCPVTILNTLDPLGKFKGKTLHVNILENKPNIASSGSTWLFDIGSLTRTMNYQPVTAGNQSNPSADGDAAFDGKEHEVDTKKPESAVNVSPSSSAQPGEQDDKTKKKDKGKSSVESFTGNRDLSVEFEDHSDNSSNDVNATGSIVPTTGQNSSNSTNPFSAVGPSNTITSPTYGKSSFKDASQLPDNLDMEDITYSDHENEELLQFKMQKAWILIDLLHKKRAIGTKWVYRNKKDERGIVVRNKARLIVQGHTQEEGIDYKEVFAPVARIEAIRLFLAYASFMGFMVYQIDVKQKKDWIIISQDKYLAEILKKFGLTKGKSASTLIDTEKPLLKDPDGEDVDVHIYRSMIGSLMYLTSSRPDIMFVVCACVHFQVTPKASHLHAVKQIFRYLKGKPHLGLWYPKDSPFDLVAYSDSDYTGASLDRKSTTGGCQFLLMQINFLAMQEANSCCHFIHKG